jgi:cytochrome P450
MQSWPKSSEPPVVLRGIASWRWFMRYLRDPLDCLAAVQQRFGPLCIMGNPVPLWPGGRRFILAFGARYNREVLGRPDTFRPGGQVLLGPRNSAHNRIRHGIFAMFGGQHRSHRRLMQPPLLKSAVDAYAPIMSGLIDQVMDRWQPGEPLDMYREMRTLSNWVAARLLFGNDDFAASIRLGETIERWLQLDAAARSSLSLINLPGTLFRQALKQAEVLELAMHEAIERNRRTRTPGSDVLSLVIQASDTNPDGMREIDLVAHAVILYAASFETTANVLAWTLFLIAQHPRIAAALHGEIVDRFQDQPPDAARIDELPLLDGVIRESMRLLPPVPLTFRSPLHDSVLGGCPVHKGDKILLSHYLTHRDPNIFPEPNRFDPSRWFTIRPDAYEYIPFSAGPRLCLGISFAQLELKLTVARIMQRFRMSVVPDSSIDGIVRLTLRPKHGIPMTVHAQDRKFAAAPIVGNIGRMVDLVA